jgi:hypothetical protein
MQFEVSDKAAAMIAELLGDPEATEEAVLPVTEDLATIKVTGHVQLRGFSPIVTNRIAQNLRFRVDAVNMGGRVRVILDIQK